MGELGRLPFPLVVAEAAFPTSKGFEPAPPALLLAADLGLCSLGEMELVLWKMRDNIDKLRCEDNWNDYWKRNSISNLFTNDFDILKSISISISSHFWCFFGSFMVWSSFDGYLVSFLVYFWSLLVHTFVNFCSLFVHFRSIFGQFLVYFYSIFGLYLAQFLSIFCFFLSLFGPFSVPFQSIFGLIMVHFQSIFDLILVPFWSIFGPLKVHFWFILHTIFALIFITIFKSIICPFLIHLRLVLKRAI